MFATTNRGLRRHLTTAIRAGALASVAAGLVVATAGTASADDAHPSQDYTVPGNGSVAVSMNCPANAPYLYHDDHYRVSTPTGAVSEENFTPIAGSQRPGGMRGQLTNSDSSPQQATVTLHCTSIANLAG